MRFYVTRSGWCVPKWLFALVSSFVAAVLTITMLPAGAMAADAPATKSEPATTGDSDGDGDPDRPDTVSASATARALKKPVEDMLKRTESARTFVNPDGTFTTKDFGEPVRIKRGGEWVDVDYNLEQKPDGSWAPKASPVDVSIDGGSAKEAARVTFDDGQSLAVTWPTDLPEPTIDGGVATYKLSDSTDLIVAVTGGGVTTRIRLNEQPTGDDPVFILGLRADGVDVSESAGGLKLVDDEGHKIGGTSVLVAWDATTDDAGEPAEVVPLDANLDEVSQSGDVTKSDLKLTTPAGYLSDPETSYPVVIDPDITGMSHVRDTWMRAGDTINRGTDNKLIVGRINTSANTNEAQSFIQFNNAQIVGKDVISAELGLWQYYGYACYDRRMYAYPITTAWTTGDMWPDRPSITTTDGRNTETNRGSAGCSAGWTTMSITNMTSAWASGTRTNNGIRLSTGDATNATYERRFCSFNVDTSSTCNTATKTPYISVTYNSPPVKPGSPTISPSTADGTTLWTTSPTPTFASTAVDPDSGTVRLHLKVLEGTTVKYDGYGSYVASGGHATKQLPSGSALIDGHTYTVQAWANDGRLDSTTGSTKVTFKVDSTPPAASTVACPGVSTDTWYDTRPASSTTCVITPAAGTETIDWTRNNKPQPLMVKDGLGAYTTGTLDIPVNGVVGLSFRARDIAGNLSAPAEFGFGTGDAGLVSPAEGERTSSTLTVEAEAPEGASSARLEQRPAGDTAAAWSTSTKVTPAGSGLTWLGTVSDTGNASSSTGKIVWDVAKEPGITAPAVREMRVCFVYSGVSKCTPARNITLVPHAFGGSFPTQDAGPGQVALFTGEFQIGGADVDVPGYSGSLSLGRSNRSYGGATTPAASVFGPGWVADLSGADAGFAAAEVVDHSADDGSITLVDTDGESSTYKHLSGDINAQALGIYIGDLETEQLHELLVLTSSGTDKFLTLLEDDGSATTWKHLGAGKWVIEKVVEPQNTSTTTFTHNAAGLVTGIYAPTPAGVTCNATTQTPGCRALQLTYTTIAAEERLTRVDLRIYDPKPDPATGLPGGGAAMVTVPVAKYGYDTAGVLTETWDPRLGDDATALKTTYEYAAIAGHKVLTKITPPGMTPWRFAYDATGRFETAKRANPASAGGGDATWTVAYDVPLSGGGLPDLSLAKTTTWGQSAAPVGAAAVFAPDKAPAGTPVDGDWAYGSISYFDLEGRTTNTASFGAGDWQIDSTVYDANGNEVWSLDAGNRTMALTSGGETEAVANSLANITTYSADGSRVEEASGPSRSVVLKDGSQIVGRDHAETLYDDEADASLMPGKPAPDPDAPPMDLMIEQVDSVVDADGKVYDTFKTRYEYNPITTGDGDGWKLGAPTRVLAQNGSGWTTTSARVDGEGKLLESRTAQGNTTAATANDARSTKTTYFTADATGGTTCGNKPEWAGLQCEAFPAGQPSGTPIPATTMYGFDYLLNATRVEETSGTMNRVAVTKFDTAGRTLADSTTVTGAPAGDQAIPSSAYEYSPTTGALTSVTAGGGLTQTTTYDEWGRALSQSDGTGNTATTVYDTAGRVKSTSDGKGTYTYTYDGTDMAGKVEHRGLVTKVDVGLISGPDVFETAYDADGSPYVSKYPNGITKTTSFDAAGVETALTYKNSDGTDLLAFSGTFDSEGRMRTSSSPMSTQEFSYDDLDRLTKVEDSTSAGCVTREYGFSLDSNRTSLTTSALDTSGVCSTAGSTTATSMFDEADRLTNAGYTYDGFGRTRTLPAKDTDQAANMGGAGGQPGAVLVDYYADDMVASLTQVVPDEVTGSTKSLTNTYALDASERVSMITAAADGVALRESTNHYASGGDSPAWTSVKTRTNATDPWATVWSRFVAGTDGLGLVESSDGSSKIQITNMHDDVVTQIDNTTTFTGLDTYAEQTEYGIARDPDVKVEGNYGWLGGHQRSTDTVGGLTLMGARLYNPVSGRFLSMDPVPGGNDNTYTYPPDPVNMTDLSGEWGMPKFIKKAFKKIVHKAKKTYRAVRAVAKKVVRKVYRAAKATVQAVRYVARRYVSTVKAYHKVVKKQVKKAAKSSGRVIKKAATEAKKSAKIARSKAHYLDDGFKALEKFNKIGDLALVGYLVATKDWKNLGKQMASIGVGVIAGGICTLATAGAAVAGCFVLGVVSSHQVDEALR